MWKTTRLTAELARVIFSTACLAVHVQNYVWLISRLDVLNNFLKTGYVLYGYFSDEANYGLELLGCQFYRWLHMQWLKICNLLTLTRKLWTVYQLIGVLL